VLKALGNFNQPPTSCSTKAAVNAYISRLLSQQTLWDWFISS